MKKVRCGRAVARLMFVAALPVALALPAAPAHASLASVWHKMFGTEETGPKPEDTLVAPFADPNDTPGAKDAPLYAPPTSPGADLAQPHRQQAEISAWLVNVSPDIFEIAPDKYDDHIKLLQTGMNDTAVNQFKAFMQSSNVLKSLGDNHMALHAYIEGAPVLLNAMALDGRYRWLFEEPVALTFLNRDVKSYEQPGVTPVNQHIILRVQIGRLPRGQGIDDMQIETFDVRQNPNPPAAPPATAASPQE